MLPELWTMPGTGWSIKSYGFMLMVGFLSGVYLAMRRARRVKCDPDVVLNCAFVALVAGIVGARIFYVVHYWDESFSWVDNRLLAVLNITHGGLEVYGGVLGALLLIPLYLRLTGRSTRLYMDIVAVSTMWALGIGRIGCFLNGCCFGGVCVDDQHQRALAAAVQFPFASPALVRQWEERRVTLPAELIIDGYVPNPRRRPTLFEATPLSRDMLSMSPERRNGPIERYDQAKEDYELAESQDPNSKETQQLARQLEVAKAKLRQHLEEISPLLAAKKLPSRVDPARPATVSEIQALAAAHPALWVHPSQLYSTVSAILLYIFLSCVFYRRRHHGLVAALMLMLYGVQRFILECIRTDNPRDVVGLTISQAVSIGMIVCGGLAIFVIYRFLPERSPRAVAFVPEDGDTKAQDSR